MRKHLFYQLAAALALCSTLAEAETFSIVVGINHYQAHETLQKDKTPFDRLAGAVNDAKLIEESLRKRGVEPVVLINDQASLANFHAAWRSVLAQAKPGAEIILSFAGHGGQEDDLAPLDEADRQDETFMFYDFDPARPEQGRLSDDELHTLFAQARDYKIVFVGDACHAGGLLRGGPSPIASRNGSRSGPYHSRPPQHSEQDFAAPALGDEHEILPHVTYLLATANDKDSIWEVGYQGQTHGALSVAFATAYEGAAGRDGKPVTTRDELLDYVRYTVARLSSHTQTPDMRPRGGAAPAFSSGQAAPAPKPPAYADLPVNITGSDPPAGVGHYTLNAQAYRLAFEIKGSRVRVGNLQGDSLAEFEAQDAQAWNRLINKYRLLDSLDARYNTAAKPVGIRRRPASSEGQERQAGRTQFHLRPPLQQPLFRVV